MSFRYLGPRAGELGRGQGSAGKLGDELFDPSPVLRRVQREKHFLLSCRVLVQVRTRPTERVAEFVQEAVGGELFEIETVKEYDADYYRCIDDAKAELQADARPELKRYLEDAGLSMDDYDTIFLGYPNWWGTCPMCVFTFLEHYDLAGKRIVPFCTNEGSGMGGSEKHLKKICPDATIEKGLAIIGNQAAQSKNTAQAWAKKFA